MQFWECCGKHYVTGIKNCKTCGKPQKVYGVVKNTPKEEEKIFKSTLLTKDGKTVEDIKRERAEAHTGEPHTIKE
jgi:hypothetical protein